MRHPRNALLVGGVLGLALVGFIGADVSSGGGVIARAFAATTLSDAELQSRLQTQGFSNVQNLRHEGRRVFVTATKDGQTGQIAVNPTTGQIAHGNDGDDDDD